MWQQLIDLVMDLLTTTVVEAEQALESSSLGPSSDASVILFPPFMYALYQVKPTL